MCRLDRDHSWQGPMTSPGGVQRLSVALLNKSLDARLRDVDAMVDAITDYGIIQLDINGYVMRWSPGAQQLFNYSPAEVLDRPMSMFYVAEDVDAGRPEQELRIALESGRFETESWRIAKDDRRFRAGVTYTPIFDESSLPTGFIAILRDLTADLLGAESMFHDLVESAADATVIADSDGRIMLANSQTEGMFGYLREDLIGRDIETLLPQRFREAHLQHRANFFTHPKPRRMGAGLKLSGLRRDGTEFPIDVSLSPLHTEQGTLVSAAIRDLTEQFVAQAELAAARAEAEVLDERDRIASDLQDHAIQRVFAVGLMLQGTLALAHREDVRQRLAMAIDELQAAVQDFRMAIFHLRNDGSDSTALRRRLDELIADVAGDLDTSVQYSGPLSVLDDSLAEQAEAVIEQAISHMARHADATKLRVSIQVADALSIDIVDNGKRDADEVGTEQFGDLQQRAGTLGGTFTVEALAEGGTRLRWSAPLP
jgi:PAS domain S-box-containing protein